MENFQLGVVLTLKDFLSKKLDDIDGKWKKFKSTLDETSETFHAVAAAEKKMSSGKWMLGGGLAVGFSLKPAIDEARAFEKELSMTAAISKVSSVELEGLKQAAIEAGMATKFSPTEAMAGLTSLASAGIQGAEKLKANLIPALDLAAASAGKLGVDQAAADMAASMTSFDASGSKVADVFVNMANIASYRVEEIGAAWRGVNLAASATNQSMETAGAVMAALKNNGATVIESGEGVRMALTALKAPSKQAADAMKYLGVEAYDKSSGKFKDLIQIFEELQNATNGMAEADKNAILQKILHEGGIKAFQAVTKVGIDNVRGYATSIGQTGTAHDFAATQIDNFDGAVQILQGNIQTLKVLLGQGLMPALKMIFQGFSFILSPIIEFLKTHPRFTQFIGVLTALTAVILTLAGAVQTSIGAWQILTVWTGKNIVLSGLLTAAKKMWLATELLSHKALIFTSGLLKTVGLTKMATAAKNMALTISEYGLTTAVLANNAAWYANPMVWVVAGIVALIAVVVAAIYYWNEWTGWVKQAWQAMIDFKSENEILVGVLTALTFPLTGTIYLLATLYQHWGDIVNALQSAWQAMIDFKSENEILIGVLSYLGGPITLMINGLISLVQYWEQITNAIGNAVTKIKDFFGIKEDPNTKIQSGMDSRIKELTERRNKLTAGGLTAESSDTIKRLDQELAGYSKQRENFQTNLKGQENYNSELKRLEDERAKLQSERVKYAGKSEYADYIKRENETTQAIEEIKKNRVGVITSGGIAEFGAMKKAQEEKRRQEEASKKQNNRTFSGMKDYAKQERDRKKEPKKGTVEYDTISAFKEEENEINKRMRAIKNQEIDLNIQFKGKKGQLEKSMQWKELQSQKEKLQQYQNLFKDLKDDQSYWTQKIQHTKDPKEIAEYTGELEKVKGQLDKLKDSKAEFLKGGTVELKAKTYSEYITSFQDKYKNGQMGTGEMILRSALGPLGLLFGGDKKPKEPDKPESQKDYWDSSIDYLKKIAGYLKGNTKLEEKLGVTRTAIAESPTKVVKSGEYQAGTKNTVRHYAGFLANGSVEDFLAVNPQYKSPDDIVKDKTILNISRRVPAPPTPSKPIAQNQTNATANSEQKVNVSIKFMDKLADFLSLKFGEEAENY